MITGRALLEERDLYRLGKGLLEERIRQNKDVLHFLKTKLGDLKNRIPLECLFHAQQRPTKHSER